MATTSTDMPTKPVAYTTLGPRLPDGRCRATTSDGSVWLYGVIPLAPSRDAANPARALEAQAPIYNVLDELAQLGRSAIRRRYVARSSYRTVHLLGINIDAAYHVPYDHPQAADLNERFGNRIVDRRLAMIGVQLRDKWGGQGTFREVLDSTVAWIRDRQVPMADFDPDYQLIKSIFDQCGIITPTRADFGLADAWFNGGGTPATPTLNHPEHLHVCHTASAMRQIEVLGADRCESLEAIQGQSAITFSSVAEFDFTFNSATDAAIAPWITQLYDADAMAVSIRARVEPREVTRDETRRQRGRVEKDIRERHGTVGAMDKPEQDEYLSLLKQVEEYYASKASQSGVLASPTLVDASIVVGFSGVVDVSELKVPALKLEPLTLSQPAALGETWLCSPIQSNPLRHDIPIHIVSAAGLNNLSFAGEEEGAPIGQTENDCQMVLCSARPQASGDRLPIMTAYASTGGGKSLMMLHLGIEWALAQRTGVIIDLKEESDHTDVLRWAEERSAGRLKVHIKRLDEQLEIDGMFDPLRILDPARAIPLAASTLMKIDPWEGTLPGVEGSLLSALQYGVGMGATCTGQALEIAQRDMGDRLPPNMVARLLDVREAVPALRAQVGRDANGEPMSVAPGLTLVMAGSARVNLPLPGHEPESMLQRADMALMRMMSYGTARALQRIGGGWLSLDEAHTFLDFPEELIRLGRIIRSWDVMMALWTQQPSDVLKNKLSPFISRTLIGPLTNAEDEAKAACEAHGIDAPRWVPRLIRDAQRATNDRSRKDPDWSGMRALRDPDGKLLRGTIWLYQGFDRSVIPVEANFDPEFLWYASTNPVDVARRRTLLQKGA